MVIKNKIPLLIALQNLRAKKDLTAFTTEFSERVFLGGEIHFPVLLDQAVLDKLPSFCAFPPVVYITEETL